MGQRLIIVTNELPLVRDREEGIALAKDHISDAILQYIQRKAKKHFTEILWAGDPGCERPQWFETSRFFRFPFNCIPVFLPENIIDEHVAPLLQNKKEPEQINRQAVSFAEALLVNLRPGDTVWIHGQDLIPLAPLLRNRIPELTIGLFIHLEFPSFSSFRLLPRNWQEELLRSFMSADLVGFKKQEHVNHFLQCILMVLGLDHEGSLVHYNNRLVKTAAFSDDPDPAKTSWANDFLPALQKLRERQNSYKVKFLDDYTRRHLYDAYRLSKKRLILLDYDGTLVSFSPKPELAVPGSELLELIHRLSASASNDVFLVSGRNAEFLEKHFGDLPVNLIAEHGAQYKWKNSSWVKDVDTNPQWKSEASKIMVPYMERCANSFIEEKEFSIAWHYRSADPEEGRLRAFEMASELKAFVENRNLQVMMGKKIVELRQSGISKGSFVRKLIEAEDYDYIFAAGDDRTDEDMFRALIHKENAFTIKVGPEASYAEYNLHTPQMIISLLQGFDHLTVGTIA